MKKILQTIAFALCICLTSYAQNRQSNFINYQGVASDASGEVISETAIALQIALKFGSETATASYIETHNPTTDANGVFSLEIGNGTLVSGVYNPNDFGFNASYITVSLNGLEIGTTELKAVPFALSSLKSGDNLWYGGGDSTNGFIQNGVTNVVIQGSLGVTPNGGTAPQGAYINEFSTDATLAGNSDTALPTEKAVKTYVDNATSGSVSRINDLIDGKTSSESIFLGNSSGNAETSGSQNTAIGNEALPLLTDGNQVTAIGHFALNQNTTGSNNIAVGSFALRSNTTGYLNTAVGTSTMSLNETGSHNTTLGSDALDNNIIGSGNVALGYQAGKFETGNSKLYISNNGTSNPLIYGEFDNNILRFNGTTEARSYFNSPTTTDLILGGTANTTAGDDGIISSDPKYAGSDIFIRSNDAVVIELDIDDNETGQFQILAGDGDLLFEVNEEDYILLNGTPVRGAANADPDLILGGTSNSASGDNGIISSDPNYAGSDVFIRSNDAVVIELDSDNNEDGEFEIKSGAGEVIFSILEDGFTICKQITVDEKIYTEDLTVFGDFNNYSDRRLKKDIESLSYGLDEVLQLQPKAYNWKHKTQEYKSLGLIAQDVQGIIKEIVTEQDDEQKTLSVSYLELIPVLINAIKEQQTQIETLKTTNTTKDVALAEILKRVKTLEYTAELNKNKGNSLSSAN
ncbi:tail fiber domain-containing protein [Winogradskyella costae]|uniref:tail fiber domain-containing protein n=1 Tax=Winogradskyella costae TaxID=2697008 RepID=UPI0015CBF9C1|nr:tail fiber domain-containing protein [Winogradskyella costae]